MTLRTLASLSLLAVGAVANAQSWTASYDEGLKAAAQGQWAAARAAFKSSVAFRPDDQSGPTVLPGPPTERRRWREGAPYSPNFLAAYAAYRQALEVTEGQNELLRTAWTEMEMLLSKGQQSNEAYTFLNIIYSRLGDGPKREDLALRAGENKSKMTFRIDQAGLTPEDRALFGGADAPSAGTVPGTITPGVPGPGGSAPVVPAANLSRGSGAAALPGGAVPKLATKFALIIANGQSRLPNAEVPFAVEDARRLKEALVANAGYEAANVEVVANATAREILAAGAALASRVPEEGTVFLYYTGAGANINGRDYLAGVDTELANDTSSMVSKTALYQPFIEKGAYLYTFYQVNRPILNGRYFGSELPLVGRIAQSQATIPGERIGGTYRDGVLVGLYTDAIILTLADFRSNRIPINEFAWQVFYKIRNGGGVPGGGPGTGGGGRQTPTLPTLLRLDATSRF